MTALRSSSLAFAGALALLAAPLTAHADGRAWAAIQKRLPADVFAVGGANMSTIRATKLYKTLPTLMATDKDWADGLAMIKSQCKIDPLAIVDDAAFAMWDAPGGDDIGVIAIAFKGVDQGALEACLTKVVKAIDKSAVTSAKAGEFTEYSATGEADKLYVDWLAPDVIAMAVKPQDKAMLTKVLGGKGVKADLAAVIGKTNTSAAIWGAVVKATPVDNIGTLAAGYGALTATKGKFAAELHLVMSSAAEATTFVTGAIQQVGEMSRRAPAGIKKIIKALKMSAVGTEAVFSTSMADQGASELMKMIDKVF
jgi:hypothetical protein